MESHDDAADLADGVPDERPRRPGDRAYGDIGTSRTGNGDRKGGSAMPRRRRDRPQVAATAGTAKEAKQNLD